MFPATLILFAKYPAPGKVKTRLVPVLGTDGAARLAEAFLLDLTERLARTLDEKIDCVLCFDPPDAEMGFRKLLADIPGVSRRFQLVPQCTGGLGERLANALASIRKTHSGPFIFIGTDAPDLPLDAINTGICSASQGIAFCMAASDGGYVLLALPADAPADVFADIRWSTRETAADQIDQLRRCGVDTKRGGDAWPDVDEPEDIAGLVERLSENPVIAPRTLCVLRSLGF